MMDASLTAVPMPAGLRTALLAGAAALLGACTNLSGLGGRSEFQCKAPEGIPCQSISGVHHNERAGNLPAQRMARGESASKSVAETRTSAASAVAGDGNAEGGTPTVASPQSAPVPLYRKGTIVAADRIGPGGFGAIRSEPTVIRIWVAPWEDADGDLNDQTYLYMQVDSGRWLIEHNRAQLQRDFAPKSPHAGVTPVARLTAPASSAAGAAATTAATAARPDAAQPAPQALPAFPPSAPSSSSSPTSPAVRMNVPPELAEALRKAAERGAAQGAAGPAKSTQETPK